MIITYQIPAGSLLLGYHRAFIQRYLNQDTKDMLQKTIPKKLYRAVSYALDEKDYYLPNTCWLIAIRISSGFYSTLSQSRYKRHVSEDYTTDMHRSVSYALDEKDYYLPNTCWLIAIRISSSFYSTLSQSRYKRHVSEDHTKNLYRAVSYP